jgi:hypothetical protein
VVNSPGLPGSLFCGLRLRSSRSACPFESSGKVFCTTMRFLSRPDSGPTPNLRPHNLRSEIARIEHAVFSKAPCDLVWKLFSDWERWPSFTDIYGSPIEWKGSPWAPGSRMQFDIARPVRARMDRVITLCTPPRCIAWINHVSGYTMEQWVLFDPYSGGTRITTWVEMTGAELCPEGHDVSAIVKGLLERFFANFGAECNRVAATLQEP